MILAQKCQKRPQGPLLEDVVSRNRAVARNIPQSPNSLLADIENRGREKSDELWDGVGVDNRLDVASGSGVNNVR